MRDVSKLKTLDGDKIVIVQIAGLIARRIVTDIAKNQIYPKEIELA